MKTIDDEENMTWPNLKAMLAAVPKEPGTLFIALCSDRRGSTPLVIFCLIIALFYISAPHGFSTNKSSPKQSLQVLKVRSHLTGDC